jgi:hypothetical protein
MKCINHPDRDATTQCLVCKTPLCDDCAIPLESGGSKCTNCTLRTTIEEMSQIRKEKRKGIAVKRVDQEEAKKKRRLYRRVLIPISLGVVIAIVQVFLYFGSSIPESEKFIASEQPDVAAIIIDEAIRDYAEDHNGIFPQSLGEVLGRYLSPEVITPRDLEEFDYKRISPRSYELRPKKVDNEMVEDLTFTE